jgi:Zn-dependent protease with chaperone function
MLVPSCLAVGALLLMLSAPVLLTRGRWQVRHPAAALLLWFGAFFVGTGLALAAVIAAAVVSTTAAPSHAGESLAVTLAAWTGLGGFGAVLTLALASAEPLAASGRAAVHRMAPVALSRTERKPFTVVRFASDEPVAWAAPGKRREIFVSTALERALTPAQRDAVIAHEWAHLRFRHGLAVRIAEVNALCLPRRLRAGRTLKRATLFLVELMADDFAARSAGAANLANALSQLGAATGDPAMALRAERLAMRRWPRRRRLAPLPSL